MSEQKSKPFAVDPHIISEYFTTMRRFLETQERIMSMIIGAEAAETMTAIQKQALPQPMRGLPEPQPPPNLPSDIELEVEPEIQPGQWKQQREATPEEGRASPPLSHKTVEATENHPDARPPGPPPPPRLQSAGQMASRETESPNATPVEPSKSQPTGQSTVAPGSRIGRVDLCRIMLNVVEEKTGYPRDLISMSQDLEGDLGLDKIKRIDIINDLLRALPDQEAVNTRAIREHLCAQTSLGALLDVLCERTAVIEAAVIQQTSKGDQPIQDLALSDLPKNSTPERNGGELPFEQAGMGLNSQDSRPSFRHVIVPREERIASTALKSLAKGRFLITLDNRGIAKLLSEKLLALGCAVDLIGIDELADEAALEHWCSLADGRIESLAGILHIAPAGDHGLPADTAISEWRRVLQLNEKSLFILLRHFSSRLQKHAHVLAASSLGGFFGRRLDNPTQSLRLQGGAVGLLNSLLEERPAIRVKAVDTDQTQTAEEVAACLMNELELAGGRQEVGYPQGRRHIFLTMAQQDPNNYLHKGRLSAQAVVASSTQSSTWRWPRLRLAEGCCRKFAKRLLSDNNKGQQ